MKNMTKDTIPGLLMQNIPRALVIGVEENLIVGAQRAHLASKGMDTGHIAHVTGQMRHFHMNQTFYQALEAANVNPTPLRGSGIVTGRSGVFTIGRFNIPEGVWINGRRSQTRRQLSYANKAIEPLVQPELFDAYVPPSEVAVFFVACFASSKSMCSESPTSIQIAVPNRNMKSWLFKESTGVFLQRYDQNITLQDDLAKPKLKTNIGKRNQNGTDT